MSNHDHDHEHDESMIYIQMCLHCHPLEMKEVVLEHPQLDSVFMEIPIRRMGDTTPQIKPLQKSFNPA